MTDFTRRWFIGGVASLGAMGGCRAFRVPASLDSRASPRLRFGVVSDVHISIEGRDDGNYLGLDAFESALMWFRDKGVDAVMVPGDLADAGILQEMKAAASAWFRVFPDDKAPDGHHVERLFVCGNHDWDGWSYFPGLMRKLSSDPTERKKIMLGLDQKGSWERIWHEPFSLVWRKEVNGYSFVGAHWTGEHCIGSSLADEKGLRGIADFYAQTEPFDPSIPFFHVQHPHPKNTCYGPWAWGHDDGETTRVLSRFPNAIAFSGHSHYSLTDERSIWQGSFTSLGAGSLKYAGLPYNAHFPEGYENTSAPRPRRNEFDPFKAMPSMDYRTHDGHHGLLVSVYADNVRFERRDMTSGRPLGDDWVMPLPAAEPMPFAFALRATSRPAPEFPAGAKLSVRKTTGYIRGGKGPNGTYVHPGLREIFVLDFPSAGAMKGARVIEYRVEITPAEGETVVKRMLADGFYLPIDHPKANASCRFCVAVDALPFAKSYSFAVFPVGSLGRVGEPIFGSFDIGSHDDVYR